ncbi:3-oxoacyl-[acyl-carrier-] synthase 3 domain protein [Pseudomonas aeruginosa]|nr:hypothetical protein [Pseudomonas aeruginosa]RCH02636.1 3-oxoacyl-[acyl-carrier-] synthase 3 domain protein [Pseudomonas aeruginosa]
MPRAAVVCGLGSYLPEAVLSNDMLAAELDTSDAWISSRTGVRQRHIAGDLGSGDLALRAASAALASAGLERVDAVVLATSTGDFCCPATAPRVAARLGWSARSRSTCPPPAPASSTAWPASAR